MGCDCKVLKNANDIDVSVNEIYEKKTLTFKIKLKIIYMFIVFYFYFVSTSIINFIKNDKLEPNIPRKLLKKFNSY